MMTGLRTGQPAAVVRRGWREKCRSSASLPSVLSVGAVRVVQDEEVALIAVALLLLVDEGEVPVLEDLPPVVPRDALQLAAAAIRAALEVEAEHPSPGGIPERCGGRFGATSARPVLHDFARARREGLTVV